MLAEGTLSSCFATTSRRGTHQCHGVSPPIGAANSSSARPPQVRHNVAMVNVFADDVGTTHPLVRQASPMVCELDEGDALFLPRG